VLVVAALAACGGSSATSSPPTTATTSPTTTASAGLTHAQFVAKLDDICKRLNTRVVGLQKQADKAQNANDYTKLAAVIEERQRVVAPYYAEMAKLTPPPADAAAFARYKEMSSRIDGILAREVAALKARDVAEVARLAGIGEQARNIRTNAALDLGTQHCGS
jgi:hypothetical protein